jgi:hypothetical protein
MIRLLIWCAGVAGCVALCWQFAVWRLALQLSLIGFTFLWVIVGGFLLSRRRAALPPRKPNLGQSPIEQLAAVCRKEYVAKYGADAARICELDEPHFWIRQAVNLKVTK